MSPLSVMAENPLCPACGARMAFQREIDVPHNEPDTIFQCPSCKLVYMTKDHVPVSGIPIH